MRALDIKVNLCDPVLTSVLVIAILEYTWPYCSPDRNRFRGAWILEIENVAKSIMHFVRSSREALSLKNGYCNRQN